MKGPNVNNDSTPLKPEQMAPHSVEAEEAVLGSALLDPAWIDELSYLGEDDFFIVRNGWVWEAMVRLRARRENIDYVTVIEELHAQKRLGDIGGAAYITYLINHTPSSVYADTYGLLVKRAKVRRELLDAASRIARLAHEEDADIHTVMDTADEALALVRDTLPREDDYLAGREVLKYYTQVMKQRVQSPSFELLTLPWEAFGPYVAGIKPGKMMLVTAFSGEGKTMFLEGLADWWATLGEKVFYISTELTREDMIDRMVCRYTGIPYVEVVSKKANISQVIQRFADKVKPWVSNIDYWETNGASARTVFAQIERAYQKGRRTIFIDYLGEAIGFDTSKRSEKEAIDNFYRALHTFAKTTGCRIIVASQLTETDFGPRAKGSRVPHEKSALHVRLESVKAKEGRVYSIDDRLIPVRQDEVSPVIKVVFEKNTFGPTPRDSVFLFKDGMRFRFLDEGQVKWTSAFTDKQLKDAAKKNAEARQSKQMSWEENEEEN